MFDICSLCFLCSFANLSILTLQSGQQLKRGPLSIRGTWPLKSRDRNTNQYSVNESSNFSFIYEDLDSPFIRQATTYLEEVDPENDTTWYTISSDGSFLSLPFITEQEEGIYSCKVANEAGIAHKTFRLDVLG